MSVRAIHYSNRGKYPCGVAGRWPSSVITSTRSRTAVTCKNCIRYLEHVAELEMTVAR